MPIFWYYCQECGQKFSWVFTSTNDAKHCSKCHSNSIVRITEKNKKVKL